MTLALGVTLAIIALVTWGVADFLIQRSVRLTGVLTTMFVLGVVGIIGFLPFVLTDLLVLNINQLPILLGTGIVLTFASLLDFEALKQGKMAIAEPIIGLETPLTVICAVFIAHEYLSPFSIALIVLIFIGTILTVTKEFTVKKQRIIEKGVFIAFLAAGGLAFANFLVGESSRDVSPFLSIWFVCVIHALICGILLFIKRTSITTSLRLHPWTLFSQAVVDNIAWVSFAGAALFIPISIAAAISSGYIGVAVLLGIFITRERVMPHQLLGVVLMCIGVSLLAFLYG